MAHADKIVKLSLALPRMSPPRFFCSLPLKADERFELPDELAHYALRVLRLRDGSDIVLFDGKGGQYPAVLHAEKKRAWASVGQYDPAEAELPQHVTLVQGIAGGDKMDWIVEKAVEMGVSRLVPVTARRSVTQLSAERREKRLAHWRRVAISASEQCGRNRLMEVAEPVNLAQWLGEVEPGTLCLACHPDAESGLVQAVARHAGPLALMVGPEGGWAEDELSLMQEHRLQPVRFGNRILRTETAGIALMGALAAIRGWDQPLEA